MTTRRPRYRIVAGCSPSYEMLGSVFFRAAQARSMSSAAKASPNEIRAASRRIGVTPTEAISGHAGRNSTTPIGSDGQSSFFCAQKSRGRTVRPRPRSDEEDGALRPRLHDFLPLLAQPCDAEFHHVAHLPELRLRLHAE